MGSGVGVGSGAGADAGGALAGTAFRFAFFFVFFFMMRLAFFLAPFLAFRFAKHLHRPIVEVQTVLSLLRISLTQARERISIFLNQAANPPET